MFFYTLADKRIVNLDHIDTITALTHNLGVRLVLNSGQAIILNHEEWEEMKELIDSYSYKKELK